MGKDLGDDYNQKGARHEKEVCNENNDLVEIPT